MKQFSGNVRKMVSELQAPVHYSLPIGDDLVPLNALLGKTIHLSFNGVINCVACGRKTNKSFSQGHCFPCMRSLASCDLCIMKPELCHFAEGTCREPEWGLAHCMSDHIVYLAETSGIKVGITRKSQVPTRWIDQGATAALPIFKVQTRYQSGLVEVLFKNWVADKTNWRSMLKGEVEGGDLIAQRAILMDKCREGVEALQEQFNAEAITALPDEKIVKIEYPVLDYPSKVSSLSFDKTSEISGILQGIKGQYLILDSGVLNIRKFTGYCLEIGWE